MNSNRSSKPKASGKPKGKNKPNGEKKERKQPTQVAAAVHEKPNRSIGMRDLIVHDVSFLAGYIYVGNGTLGATDSIYFQNIGKTKINQYAASSNYHGNQIPFSPVAATADLDPLYPTYVSDVMKHYARYRLRRSAIELVSLQPATSNSMLAQISPVRGAGDSGSLQLTTGTVAGASYADTVGMSDSRSATSWQNLVLDMTRYCAGGSGASQNEFTTDAILDDNTGATETPISPLAIPSAFVVSGQNNTAALRGTQTHAVIFRFQLDLLDFIAGGTAAYTPAAFAEAMIRRPTPRILAFVEALGGDALLRLLESRSKVDSKTKFTCH